MIEVFTDGSGNWKTGEGGWGVYIPSLDVRLSGSAKGTTNNRMEIQAVIEAIKYIQDNNIKDDVDIYSDSEYTVKSFNIYWRGWVENDWTTSTGNPVKNQDLMKKLIRESENPQFTLKWVKGHDKSQGNIEADRLAYLAYSSQESDVKGALEEKSLIVISGSHKGIGKVGIIFNNEGEVINEILGGTNRYKENQLYQAARYAYNNGIGIIRTDNKKFIDFDVRTPKKGSGFWDEIRALIVHEKIKFLPILEKIHEHQVVEYKKRVKKLQDEHYKNYIPEPPKNNMHNSSYFERF